MREIPRRRFVWIGFAIAAAVAGLLAVGFVAASAPVALAQEARPWSLRNLFFPRRAQRMEPRQWREPGERLRKPSTPRTKPPQRKTAIKRVVEPEIVIDPKAPDAKVVLVIGDFIGGGLAEGLDMLFAENPRVRVVDRTNGASGFVREDHFDWPGNVAGIVATEKPAVVVALVGANDRQQMRIGDRRETLRSEAWTREYSARAASFASAIWATDVPFVWVGTTPFKSPKATSDMLALNDIYRKVAADVGAEFIDVWEGFVDEKGSFITSGADISGQPVRLRSGDGINFTAAGKRKLAFYAEKPLKRLLGEAGAGAPTGPGVEGVPPGGTGPMVPTDRTVPMALNDPELDGGTELLGATASSRPKTPARPAAAADDATVAGRADDFSWPRGQAAAVPQPARDGTATASTQADRRGVMPVTAE
ncbi:SGNH/GDSL hydrolase family protein [Kumtagia ephedrae]|uniref:DUF459 domain-containing protein n=1 Tax=Kumtagia ephedrae TaxID=2116701 RepID=A0A2P7SLW2_9HYPH|nr:DUF459 domain-containing protein [Mesorhizobium ephedrae]PSJ63401.1 DUF459 domain-containing protein [Mesorhizobium ephedrae]